MRPLIALDLVEGPVPTAALFLAIPAGVFLLARRWRRGALVPLLAAVLAAVIAWAAGQWATASGLSTHPLPLGREGLHRLSRPRQGRLGTI